MISRRLTSAGAAVSWVIDLQVLDSEVAGPAVRLVSKPMTTLIAGVCSSSISASNMPFKYRSYPKAFKP